MHRNVTKLNIYLYFCRNEKSGCCFIVLVESIKTQSLLYFQVHTPVITLFIGLKFTINVSNLVKDPNLMKNILFTIRYLELQEFGY